MNLFKNILKDNESLFIDELALDFEFLPKLIPYRENEQQYIAQCIKPLFQDRNGKNLILTGKPGIGKTAAIRHIFQELEQETQEIIPIYINCWKKDTPFKIVLELCNQLDFKFTQNKNTDELLKEVTKILNKKSVVLALDEIDKLEDYSILYSILEDIHKKTILLITNEKSWILSLDQRIKSRLLPEVLEFKPYNYNETSGILKQRIDYAFVPNVFSEQALEPIAKKTSELEDIRTGLFLLKEAGTIAEQKSQRSISLEHSHLAIEKIKDFKITNSQTIEDPDEKLALKAIRENSGSIIGDIYKKYQELGGEKSYKTFTRRVDSLEASKIITKRETSKGTPGKSTIISYGANKALKEF